MVKNKIFKILGGIVIICLMFSCSAFGTFKIVEAKNFNNLVNCANQKFNTGNYDEAITLYNKALQIKNNNDIIKNIAIAQNYKQYMDIYNQSIKLMTEKKYSEAIQKLSTINQASGQIYANALNKIEECKKNIISEDIKSTNTAISNKDYDSANKYIENILKLDANNNDAKQLKTTIVQAQQKDKEEAQQRRILEQNKIQQSKVQQKNNNQTTKSNELERQKNIDAQIEILEYKINSSPKGSQERRNLILQEIELLKQK